MIPFAFDYIAPDTLEEAVDTHARIVGQGRAPVYFAGGTEVITMARVNSLAFDAVIDIKHIPQCRGYGIAGENLVLGAAASLNDIALSRVFPLLSKACARIADHTAQCKITLGGNVAGTIIYHEAALALLLADASVLLAGLAGVRECSLSSLYHGKLALQPGELIVQFTVDPGVAALPFVHAKHTEGEKIGYPLFTLAAVRYANAIKAAIGGYYPHPAVITLPLSSFPMDTEYAIGQLMLQLAGEPITDTLGSAEYRRSMLVTALRAMLVQLGGFKA